MDRAARLGSIAATKSVTTGSGSYSTSISAAASAAISGGERGDAGDDLALEPHDVLREQVPVLTKPP